MLPPTQPPAPEAVTRPALVGVVLAAGASRRMGQPKALLPLRGLPLVRHHVDRLSARCARVRVVVGAHAAQLRAVLPAWVEPIENPAWATTGPWESLRLALAGLAPDDRVLITPVDAPPAALATLDALLDRGAPAVPARAGADGHPVLACVRDLLAAPPDATLRDLLVGAPRVEVADPAVVLNLNTPDDWRAWLAESAAAPGGAA